MSYVLTSGGKSSKDAILMIENGGDEKMTKLKNTQFN